MKTEKVYNRIFTQEKWDMVNKYNKNLMNDFLLELKSQKKKESTIKQYKNDLRILFIYILDELDNKPISKLNKKSFRNYSLWLNEECHMSNARVNRLLSALRSMLTYATDDDDYDDIEINYAAKVKGLQKDKVRDIVFLSMDEVNYLYDTLIKNKKYQQATLLGLMIDSACRRNEAYQVEKSSITEDGALTNTVVGKRGKKFRLLYNDMTKKAFKLYMEQRGEDNIESLWITKDANGQVRKASYESLYYWVRSWRPIIAEYSGVDKNFNAHSFRHIALELLSTGEHYICKKLGKKKFELRELQLLANHSDISTTASYLADKSEDELLSAFGLKKE